MLASEAINQHVTAHDANWKNTFIELFKTGPISIIFTKKDGSERKMICTLKEELIPLCKMPKSKTIYDNINMVVRVFDLEKNAWRSVDVQKIITVKKAKI